jgi:ribonuclease III
VSDGDTLDSLEEALGYAFRDRALLEQALTHASFCNESREALPDNERLEFLGDAIVGTAIAAAAFERFPDAPEGDLTRIKSAVVNGPALAEQARALDLGTRLRLGRGAALADRAGDTPSVLADTFEAVVGAIFLDGGYEAARAFVLRQLGPALDTAGAPGAAPDAKSVLQVACLKRDHAVPRYEVVGHSGPPHAPSFTVRATLPDGRAFTGAGRTKKDAEQAAAAEAVRSLDRA